jgi:hypothetical protein
MYRKTRLPGYASHSQLPPVARVQVCRSTPKTTGRWHDVTVCTWPNPSEPDRGHLPRPYKCPGRDIWARAHLSTRREKRDPLPGPGLAFGRLCEGRSAADLEHDVSQHSHHRGESSERRSGTATAERCRGGWNWRDIGVQALFCPRCGLPDSLEAARTAPRIGSEDRACCISAVGSLLVDGQVEVPL